MEISRLVLFEKIKRLVRYGLFSSVLFGLIFYVDTHQVRVPQLITGFIFGVLFGVLEELCMHKIIVALTLPRQYLIKLSGMAFLMILLAVRAITVHHAWEEITFGLIISGFSERRIVDFLISAIIVAMTISMYFQMERLIGKNMLMNYFKGQYKKPKKEIRIFLFLDLKSSTAINEKLGNDVYYSFLNQAISEMSEAIIATSAEIYQYVGDEIVFSWKFEKGIRNNNCFQLYEKITRTLHKRRAFFMKRFGYFPEFKGSLHAGPVLAAEIGHIRKEIIYSGDVLNASARILTFCKQIDAQLIISKLLFNMLEKKHEIHSEEIGSVELRGKEETIELLKISLPFLSPKAPN